MDNLYIADKKLLLINKLNLFLNIIAVLFFVTWSLTPYLFRNTSTVVLMTFIIVWLISTSNYYILNGLKIIQTKLVLLVILWNFWEYLLMLVGYSTTPVGNLFFRSLFWLPLLMVIFMIVNYPVKWLKFVKNYIFIIIVLNIIDNVRLLLKFPLASELINYSWGAEYLKMNIGTTMNFAVALFFLSILLVCLIRSKRYRLILLGTCVLSFIYILMGQRVIAISIAFINIVGIVIIMTLKRLNKKSKLVLGMLIVSLITAAILPIIYNLDLLASLISDDRISSRILDLQQAILYSNAQSGSVSSRIHLTQISLTTFFSSFQSFLIGVGYKSIMNVYANQVVIGQHSEFIDLLARYGIVGGISITLIFYKIYQWYCNLTGELFRKIDIFIIITVFVIYSVLNNSFSPEIGVIMFIFLPLILLLGDYNKYENRRIVKKN